jgi:hypothetical protein
MAIEPIPIMDSPAFSDRGFIDHHNLRELHRLVNDDGTVNQAALDAQVAEIKGNLDRAAAYGINSYVLFSRGFERLICYDFLLPPPPGEPESEMPAEDGQRPPRPEVDRTPIFADDSPHRRQAAILGEAVKQVIRYAHERRIRVIFHTNQFEFPEEVYQRYGDSLAGTARVCPARGATWRLFRGKIEEFFRRFPTCDGLQITTSETQVRVTACSCDRCRHISPAERFARMAKQAHAICHRLGKELQFRTWGDIARPDHEADYLAMLAALPDDVIISTKNTSGDFHLLEPASHLIGKGDRRCHSEEHADAPAEAGDEESRSLGGDSSGRSATFGMTEGKRGQVIEFDCWGEYRGYNQFPCYLGDLFAERLRLCRDRGVGRVAARLNWNPGVRPIFEIPYGNDVNAYLFARLAQDPDQDPDALLRDWVSQRFPAAAVDDAVALYQFSPRAQAAWLTLAGGNCNDHSRVFRVFGGSRTYRARVRSQIREALDGGYQITPAALDERRRAIDAAHDEAVALVERLRPHVPAEWADDLRRQAENERQVAHCNTDALEMLYHGDRPEAGEPLPDLSALERGLRDRLAAWRERDPEAYELLGGEHALAMLEQLKGLSSGGDRSAGSA